MTKTERREAIRERAETNRELEREMTYWLTRDRSPDGSLSESVDVWLHRPTRKPNHLGAYWTSDVEAVETGSGPRLAKYAVWSLAQCTTRVRVYPDDDVQCIRVGDDPPAPTANLKELS